MRRRRPLRRPGVSILAAGYKPAVVLIPPGGEVEWTNTDSRPHRLVGEVDSLRALAPGEKFRMTFRNFGQYDYRDAANPAMKGTVVVVLAGQAPGRVRGRAQHIVHRYKATLTLDVQDRMQFYDSAWQTLQGPCNGEVGHGERDVHLVARFRRVEYSAFPRANLEGVSSGKARASGSYSERTQAGVATAATPEVACPNRSLDHSPTQEASCSLRLPGSRFRFRFDWTPAGEVPGAFAWNAETQGTAGSCPPYVLGALGLVGIELDRMPLNPSGFRLDYDEGQTSPATRAELRALRSGRSFTVRRSYELHFTTDCCNGFNPGRGGVLARVGGVFDTSVKLAIRFTRRR